MSGENEILHFIAIVPNNTDFDKENFFDVRSPNPEDVAQLIVKELSKSNQISVASFGPRTVTSHSYLVGKVSVLDSLLHSFIDAKVEVKVIIQNSNKRYPRETGTYYSIKTNSQISELFKRISTFPENDYIKAILNIQKYTIILVSLPPFIPFHSKASMKYNINGWNVLMNPSSLIHTRSFALLHIDPNLPTESAVLKFLPNEERTITFSEEDNQPISKAILIENDKDYLEEDNEEYYSDDQHESNKNEIKDNNSRASRARKGKSNDQDKSSVRSRDRIGESDRSSIKSADRERERERERSNIDNNVYGDLKLNNFSDLSNYSNRNNNNNINNNNNDDFVDNKLYGAAENESENDPTWAQNESEDDNDKNGEYENQDSPSSQAKSGRSKRRKVKKVIRKKKPIKQTIDIHQLIEEDQSSAIHDSESSIPTEANINFEEEEEEASIEIQIQQFVSKLQLNIPVLTDTSVFSTLFQQLFYERWKSGILSRCRTDISNLRDSIKTRSTDEITALKQLVNSQDLSLFVSREEQRMRLLEAKTVETIQQVMEKRLSNYANVTQKSFLKNFQILCGDHVTLQRQIREKRAEIRSLTMDLRIAQNSRMEKMQDYHNKVQEIQKASTAQSRYNNAVAELQRIGQEKTKLETDREALIKQRERVRALLESKKNQRAGKKK